MTVAQAVTTASSGGFLGTGLGRLASATAVAVAA